VCVQQFLICIVASCNADIPVGSGPFFAGFHVWLKSESAGNAGWKTGVTSIKPGVRAVFDPGKVAVVQTITLTVPDSLLRQAGGSLEKLAQEALLLLACKYFELGKLNFAQAAAMCRLERADFLAAAKVCGVPVGDWEGL
jgi:hypothetical protein